MHKIFSLHLPSRSFARAFCIEQESQTYCDTVSIKTGSGTSSVQDFKIFGRALLRISINNFERTSNPAKFGFPRVGPKIDEKFATHSQFRNANKKIPVWVAL